MKVWVWSEKPKLWLEVCTLPEHTQDMGHVVVTPEILGDMVTGAILAMKPEGIICLCDEEPDGDPPDSEPGVYLLLHEDVVKPPAPEGGEVQH